MRRYIYILILLLSGIAVHAQTRDMTDTTSVPMMQVGNDSLPRYIPFLLPKELFIPADRLFSYAPWSYAPIERPTVFILPTSGFNGSVGFGLYSIQHPDKFFSTFNGDNTIDIPGLYLTEQKFLGNTLRLGKKTGLYFMSGIMYGSQLGVLGNNWGMGTREGILWHPNGTLTILVWSQDFQSVRVYTPILFRRPDGDTAAILMPATPEVFSFGAQASFTVGEFIVGVGFSVAPVPFQKRRHSVFRYR